jgi:hypothetical protein
VLHDDQPTKGIRGEQMGQIAKSRRLDPQTSHDAGASMQRAATLQAAAVLNCLRAIREAGAEEIGELIGMDAYAVRKRLPELQDAGFVDPTDQRRKTRSGRSERIWRIVWMSWLFSQALVEEYSEATCSDGEPSVQSNGSLTQLAYLPPDKMKDFSRLSRFGMTFKPLTADRGEELLTLYLEASRARTLALPEKAQASTASGQECGDIWRGSLARYDQVSCTWKTAQQSLLGDLDECSVIWPRSGMTADGQCWELPTLERRTSGTGFGLWPTPTCMAGSMYAESNWMERKSPSLASAATFWKTPMARDWKGHTNNPESKGYGGTLPDQVKKWPTPQANDNRDRGNLGSGAIQRRKDKGKQIMLSQSVSATSGALNPPWVEWLMGWPLGWTDLKPLETVKFQAWQRQLGNS